jgi:hypothetical protein
MNAVDYIELYELSKDMERKSFTNCKELNKRSNRK